MVFAFRDDFASSDANLLQQVSPYLSSYKYVAVRNNIQLFSVGKALKNTLFILHSRCLTIHHA